MLRSMLLAPFGLLVALLLFYSLAAISTKEAAIPQHDLLNPNLDFLLVRNESDVEIRKRELPPEPEELLPQSQPDTPKLQPESVRVEAVIPSVDVPDIDVDVSIALTPSLNDLEAPVVIETAVAATTPTPTPVPKLELAIDTNPTALKQVPPRYPSRARRKKIEGHVTVEFIVTKTGAVKAGSVVVIDASPEGVFDSAVIRAVQRWRFKARETNGVAVPFKARQSLEFKLDR